MLARLGKLSSAAITYTFMVGLYYVLVAFGNLTDYSSNEPYVRAVVGGTDGFDGKGITDPDLAWRFISEPWVQTGIYWVIIAFEVAAAVLLLWAVRAGARSFGRFRQLATIGYLVALALFLVGFFTVGGEFFAMWQNSTFNGQDAAFRNIVIAGIGLGLLWLRDPAPVEGGRTVLVGQAVDGPADELADEPAAPVLRADEPARPASA